LQTTLERNPAIQVAKSGLEQTAGQRLVFRSVAWPDVELGVPAGVQGGHRAGESGTKGFGVGRGVLTQTLFNAGLPASLRRGDVEVLIAQQQLNVAVVDQLHAARLAFYSALYYRSLESIRREQQRRLQENVTTQRSRFEAGLADKSVLTSATVQASELDTQIESAHRAYLDAQLQLALAMAIDLAKASLPEPEGELQSIPIRVDLDSETAGALQRRAGGYPNRTADSWKRISAATARISRTMLRQPRSVKDRLPPQRLPRRKAHARYRKALTAAWRRHSNTASLKMPFWRPRADY